MILDQEAIYICSTCNRTIRMPVQRYGIDVASRCIITRNCRGKLSRSKNIDDVSSTPAFPPSVEGVKDWYQRRMLHEHTQPTKSPTWTITHNLQNKPIVYVYTTHQTSASEFRLSYTSPTAGVIWYKTIDGEDPTNPSDPAKAGLYEFNGAVWKKAQGTMPVGLSSSGDVFTYLKLTQPASVESITPNVTKVVLSSPNTGMAQCVSSSSQRDREVVSVTSSTTRQVSNLGEITIATLNTSPVVTVGVKFDSSVVTTGVPVLFTNVDNTASVLSAWVGVGRVYVNGKTYTVRSFNMNTTDPMPTIVSTGAINSSFAPFVFETMGATPGEALILLSNSPHGIVDRDYTSIVDVHTLNSNASSAYYADGEIVVSSQFIKPLYPGVHVVD